MRKYLIGAAALALTWSLPAFAQDSAVKAGPFWQANRIYVEDGQFENYMDWLSKTWTANQEYAKSQGWLLEYHILNSVNPRDGEPNVILLTRFNDVPSAAESERRNAMMNQRMQQTDKSADAASGDRTKMRKLMGSALYVEMLKR
ncbi:hypothetical protein H9L14_05120 [Sphingomonas sediminicola]|jgi:hypothetical protein|uniref:Uncharacterized protein n=1 Tax=Sphingomonas sediminicola TaxID=386874 RepID=A0ABX6TCP6_9SPHN|nr:hypothetical protein [Sphingomonas sediminicola]QNP46523.1 hypothetical protein H9L14_05120 [Sphingomonas sediminicola]